MRTQAQEVQNEAKPIILTMILAIAALTVLLIFRQFPNANSLISIGLYLLIDVGFLNSYIARDQDKEDACHCF